MTTHKPAAQADFLRALNPFAMLGNLWTYRDLIRQFTVREVLGRYRGSLLGFLWTFLSPLLMLSVYTFVFGTILHPTFDVTKVAPKVKGFDPTFAMTLFCGMIVFNIFSETIMRAPQLILGNVNYVKKVVFPLEVLPVSVLGCGLIYGAASTVVLLAGVGLLMKHMTLYMLYFLLALLPLVMLCCGLCWIIASLGVFMRDLAPIITFVVQLLMFMTPIFYPPEMFDKEYRWVFSVNPLSLIIADARRAMIWDQAPWWPGWFAVTGIAFAFMMLGYAWFMHSKKFFADVI